MGILQDASQLLNVSTSTLDYCCGLSLFRFVRKGSPKYAGDEEEENVDGKVVVITGASAGVGKVRGNQRIFLNVMTDRT